MWAAFTWPTLEKVRLGFRTDPKCRHGLSFLGHGKRVTRGFWLLTRGDVSLANYITSGLTYGINI